MRYRLSLWSLLILAAVVLATAPALAHAVLVKSSPRDKAVLSKAPEQVVLRFNSRIEQKLTQAKLLDGDGHTVQIPRPKNGYSGKRADEVIIPMPDLKPGAYRLNYQVFATDGHISPGILRFSVSRGKAP